MTRDDIIRMAREANILEPIDLLESNPWRQDTIRELERFAALVAAAERERIKQANAPEIERINAHIKELEDAVKKEREACAKVCEKDATAWGYDSNGASCAIAIRARGQTQS